MTTRIDVTRYDVSLAGLFLAATVVACSNNAPSPSSPSPTAGTGGGGGSTAPTFTQISSEILTPACVVCHTDNGRSPAGGMNLTASVAYANLVNVGSTGKPGAIRVVPGDPTNSYLVQKLLGRRGSSGSACRAAGRRT